MDKGRLCTEVEGNSRHRPVRDEMFIGKPTQEASSSVRSKMLDIAPLTGLHVSLQSGSINIVRLRR